MIAAKTLRPVQPYVLRSGGATKEAGAAPNPPTTGAGACVGWACTPNVGAACPNAGVAAGGEGDPPKVNIPPAGALQLLLPNPPKLGATAAGAADAPKAGVEFAGAAPNAGCDVGAPKDGAAAPKGFAGAGAPKDGAAVPNEGCGAGGAPNDGAGAEEFDTGIGDPKLAGGSGKLCVAPNVKLAAAADDNDAAALDGAAPLARALNAKPGGAEVETTFAGAEPEKAGAEDTAGIELLGAPNVGSIAEGAVPDGAAMASTAGATVAANAKAGSGEGALDAIFGICEAAVGAPKANWPIPVDVGCTVTTSGMTGCWSSGARGDLKTAFATDDVLVGSGGACVPPAVVDAGAGASILLRASAVLGVGASTTGAEADPACATRSVVAATCGTAMGLKAASGPNFGNGVPVRPDEKATWPGARRRAPGAVGGRGPMPMGAGAISYHPDADEAGGMLCTNDELLKQQREAIMQWVKSMGKRLLTGSINLINTPFPVNIFEPRSYLEKLADVWVYPRYLAEASQSSDPVERMKLPFNPILGETWQASLSDGTTMFMEQISHHPPVSAFHMEGPGGAYRFLGLSQPTVSIVVKYYGFKTVAKGFRYVDFPDGTRIELHYPQYYIKNVVYGSSRPRAEVDGQAILVDVRNKLKTVINFGALKGARNKVLRRADAVYGFIYDCRDNQASLLEKTSTADLAVRLEHEQHAAMRKGPAGLEDDEEFESASENEYDPEKEEADASAALEQAAAEAAAADRRDVEAVAPDPSIDELLPSGPHRRGATADGTSRRSLNGADMVLPTVFVSSHGTAGSVSGSSGNLHRVDVTSSTKPPSSVTGSFFSMSALNRMGTLLRINQVKPVQTTCALLLKSKTHRASFAWVLLACATCILDAIEGADRDPCTLFVLASLEQWTVWVSDWPGIFIQASPTAVLDPTPNETDGIPLASIEGSWLSHLNINEKRYWCVATEVPDRWRSVAHPLPSDSRFRQ
ncbi:hypothetical protein VOLCADRAFT_121628, partial [Volvox carteri f. nagariensis]